MSQDGEEITVIAEGVVVAEAKKLLSIQEVRKLGALQVPAVHDDTMDAFLEQQKEAYQEHSKEELIEALIDRDRQLASEGRALADGRIGGRLLREFVRGVLYRADNAEIAGVKQALLTGKVGAIDQVLKALGAEEADARQIRLHGHTLGDDEAVEAAERKFHGEGAGE